MTHVSEYKKKELEDVKKLLTSYPTIGIIDITDLPSMQLQKIRSKLRNTLLIKTTKKRLLKLAMTQVKDKKQGIEKLESKLNGICPALLLTKEDPFKIANLLRKNKSSAPAKAGQIAPFDLVIKPGPTSFTPGPIIGELGQVGIKTAVEGGKLAIKNEVTLTKEGALIEQKVVDVLSKFGIEPMEVGINLMAVLEDGMIYAKDVLDIDEETYLSNIRLAYQYSFNLAIKIEYLSEETSKFLIKKAFIGASALASLANLPKESLIKEEQKSELVIEGNKEDKIEELPKKDTIIESKSTITEEDMKKAKETWDKIVDEKIKEDDTKSKRKIFM